MFFVPSGKLFHKTPGAIEDQPFVGAVGECQAHHDVPFFVLTGKLQDGIGVIGDDVSRDGSRNVGFGQFSQFTFAVRPGGRVGLDRVAGCRQHHAGKVGVSVGVQIIFLATHYESAQESGN